MPGCLDCPTSDTCALCNDTGQFALSGTTCACNAGFVLAGSQCLTCGSAIPNCLTCTSAVMCTSCESGYFVDPITRLCLTCASAMPGCLTCSSSMACTSCDSAAQFGLSGSVCTCNAGYVLLGTECVTCGSAMPNCETCSSATICTSCSSSYFVNATTSQCSTCLNAMPGCLTCTSSSACTDCDIASQFTLSGTTCVCSTGYTLSGT
jgi:proprotein convertase subtilisin/kexin type 5